MRVGAEWSVSAHRGAALGVNRRFTQGKKSHIEFP
jgi:hypothetical protein